MKTQRFFSVVLAAALACTFLTVPAAKAAEKAAPDSQAVTAAVARAVDFLRAHQAEDGSFDSAVGTGVTSLVIAGMLQNGYTADDPTIAKALKFLESMVQDDGSIYDKSIGVGNYETSLAVVVFNRANTDRRYDSLLKNAEKYLRKYQWDEDEGLTPADIKYGGAGYGGPNRSRADMSNTGFLLDALVELGAGKDDEAIKKALVFVSRCQYLESQYNTLPYATENPDGGFIYTIMDYQQLDEDGKEIPLRSYGSITYVGYKSLVYAGLADDDIRVQAVTKWLKNHYSVTENPGMGATGLYYYRLAMSKALKALGKDTFTDADGTAHDWRADMLAALLADQQADGSWVNEKRSRWMENNTNLVTAYALLTIGVCR